MKRACGLGLLLLSSLLAGCGPGLSHRVKEPSDVFAKMDKELANAIATTSLTSGRMERKIMVDEWDEPNDEAPAPLVTWGASSAAEEPATKYGF